MGEEGGAGVGAQNGRGGSGPKKHQKAAERKEVEEATETRARGPSRRRACGLGGLFEGPYIT